VDSTVYELTASLGYALRFSSLDAGLRLRAGLALFDVKNDGDRLFAPALAASPELFGRFYWGKPLFLGAAMSFSGYYTPDYPVLSAFDLNLTAGWVFGQ